MRALCFAFVLAGATACGGQPLCGEDDGEPRPICSPGSDQGGPGDYCPNDHWAKGDDCNSCGCSPTGVIVCNTNVCGAE